MERKLTLHHAHTASQACVNCSYDKRIATEYGTECRCEIDNHYIGYVACFEQTCEEFKRTTKWDKKEE